MAIEERLRVLEREAAKLELDPAQRHEQLRAVERQVESYLTALDEQPVYMQDDGKSGAAELGLAEQPARVDAALDALDRHVFNSGFNIGSQRYLAYIPSGGLYPSALADYLAAATNRYAGVQFAAPGVTRLERMLVRWIADELGYPPSAQGDLTSGGSIAALSAIVAARESFAIRSKDVGRHVVYQTSLTHHTFAKALRIAGLADCPLRTVALDGAYRMDAAELERAIVTDKANGLVPWLVAATAGTTDLGTVDPLDAIADLAERHGFWFHVDGAYGGAFALCGPGRERLAGIARSDSMILDPHKGLFIPFGTGIVLVREGRHLLDAYYARGAYMQDLKASEAHHEQSAADLSPELTRPFRGLRLWLPLKIAGIAPFRAALEEKLLLAEYAWERLQAMPAFDVGPQPDLSITAFRYLPKHGDANAFNLRLADKIREDGRTVLSTTTLDGMVVLRLAILGYNTHMDDIDLVLDLARQTAERLATDTS
jgi:glutamate/tyrosine decarboxylase-like PLP-dependent enzyme